MILYNAKNYKQNMSLLIDSLYMSSSLGKPDYHSNAEITFQIKSTSNTTRILPIGDITVV